MSEYSDIEQINKLVAEQAHIQLALDVLADSGTVSSVVCAPTLDSENPSAMPVQVSTPDASQAMISGVRNGLKKRYNDISHELRDLGVSGVPEDIA